MDPNQQNSNTQVPNGQQVPVIQGYYVMPTPVVPGPYYNVGPTDMNNIQQQPTLQQPQYYVPTTQAQFYVPQSPAYYYAPNQPTTVSEPLIPSSLPLNDRLTSIEYEVRTGYYYDEAWALFKKHWMAWVGLTIFFIGLQFIPYVGGLLAAMILPGFFIAGTHAIRPGPMGGFVWNNMFHGFYYFFPLFAISLIYSLVVFCGFLLCIIPGLYFMIVFSFAQYVYIEYRNEGMTILGSFSVSNKQVNKHFWSITGLLIVTMALMLLGVLCLGVGVLVTMPVAMLMYVFAFRDMFGLSEVRNLDKSCYCC